ncbi:DeoR/GlpR family DNA-binding transcription regulator [Roseicitreum antarcticum]|uniref:Transcriptional regulator, DeoR family n=1 Tax=Roseicitreum antarcticum TaxID=564137 RepID=A0A1H2YVR6_9RHOB|nr:DeoR/GlpR family DNA-binding transcription regulator [Roseicitreum antarcticum]SDX09272.1 transcriptional regulator, DeoR family [Roseicitreum antarcticum]
MTRPSMQSERIARITAMLDVSPALHLKDLAVQLGVTVMTLRRDAAQAGSGFACRGGYVVPDRNTEHYDFETQMSHAINAKQKASEYALNLVPEGAVVFLDTGTTLPHLARLLAKGRAKRLVTHCLTIAEILQGRSQVPVEFLGGEIQSSTRSCHADHPARRIAALKIDIAFLSAGGVDPEGQLSCSHAYEIPLKRALISHCVQSLIVFDESKIGQRKSVVFGDLDEVGAIVTERGIFSADELKKRLTPSATN